MSLRCSSAWVNEDEEQGLDVGSDALDMFLPRHTEGMSPT